METPAAITAITCMHTPKTTNLSVALLPKNNFRQNIPISTLHHFPVLEISSPRPVSEFPFVQSDPELGYGTSAYR